MKNYSLLLLLFCCTFFLNACSDDDDTPSREEMLMNKRWQITGLTVSTPLGSIDYYEEFEDCMRDNYIEFRSGGILVMNEGPTKCNDSAPQENPGTWSLEGNTLRISGIGAALSLQVDELELQVTELTNTSLAADFETTFSGFTFDGNLEMTVQQ
ncbi:lipocalin family protein [Sabulibacter ruber]|uniref:lipocalin family protein n=1 Tax=Sabulibacter ruber TaxID=2811901 RepID=UPI001A97C968|nr:lipocalin family protein [Sabulibacter ruber]